MPRRCHIHRTWPTNGTKINRKQTKTEVHKPQINENKIKQKQQKHTQKKKTKKTRLPLPKQGDRNARQYILYTTIRQRTGQITKNKPCSE